MPIYAFACTACGHAFDKLQKLSDPDPSTCPACGAAGTVQRQLTAPSFRLAGGGWYETDFKKEGKRNLAGEGGEGAKPSNAAKADAKPSDAKADGGSSGKASEARPAAKVEPPKPASKPE